MAQSTNGTYTLIQDVVSAAGGQVGGGNPMSAQTTLGLPAAGSAANLTFTLVGGVGESRAASGQLPTVAITVTGTIDDATATVTVNGVTATVTGTTFSAQGVPLALGRNTVTAVATDPAGNTTSRSITVYLDLPELKKTPRFSIDVRGTVDDPTATVSVNGVQAAVTSGQFVASVLLTDGFNTLTATATDAAGNTGTASIRVFVPLPAQRPPMPTVGTVGTPIPAVTTEPSVSMGGTKTAGTAIWINGTQVVSLNDETTWTATVTFVEGDNAFRIVAKAASGATSAEAVINVIKDTLPPVITAASTKTNITPFAFTGTVDDSLTNVDVNGVLATRSGTSFTASVPLVAGANTVTITATSPNHYVSTTSVTITLGTVPTIQSVQPPDGTILYAQTASVIQIAATDTDNDAMQYRLLIDNATVRDWGPSPSASWTPGAAEAGLHTLTVDVRDDYGGSRTQTLEVFVVRQPVLHP